MTPIPVVFVMPRSLRVLNVLAVAASMAACTSAGLMWLFYPAWTWAIVAGVPTFAIGAIWAALLRWRKATRSGIRWGWLLSIPLAALNGAIAVGALFASDAHAAHPWQFFVDGAITGATLGVVYWGPALVAVLLAFGLPIARAQRLAKQGLAGEERGEVLVGLASLALAIVAFMLARGFALADAFAGWTHLAPVGTASFYAFVAIAVVCGGAATAIAGARERRRRAFLERVEHGEEPAFRVEPTALGKVLVRVGPVASYRVADRAEELFAIDDAGRVTHRIGESEPRTG